MMSRESMFIVICSPCGQKYLWPWEPHEAAKADLPAHDGAAGLNQLPRNQHLQCWHDVIT